MEPTKFIRFFNENDREATVYMAQVPDDFDAHAPNLLHIHGFFHVMILGSLAAWAEKNAESPRTYSITIYPEENRIHMYGTDFFWTVVTLEKAKPKLDAFDLTLATS